MTVIIDQTFEKVPVVDLLANASKVLWFNGVMSYYITDTI